MASPKPNPQARRHQGVMSYLTPELNQSVRNLAAWFGTSKNDMFNRLLRLGIQNEEFMAEAMEKKKQYKHDRAIEFLHMDFNKQKPITKTGIESDKL